MTVAATRLRQSPVAASPARRWPTGAGGGPTGDLRKGPFVRACSTEELRQLST